MSPRKVFLRLAECLLLFIALPVAYYFGVLPIPKIVTLLAVMAGCVLILKFDSTHKLSKLFAWPDIRPDWKTILLKTLTVAAVIFILVMMSQPEALFSLPQEVPWMWVLIMLLYPVLSVLPQEVIYRVFFFERYKVFFRGEGQLVLFSALCFSFLHIIYNNWWAVILSFIGGLIFSRTYQKSRSLWWVSLEHAIYGCLIFTLGMGHYFYDSI